jgi:hypothetical protein
MYDTPLWYIRTSRPGGNRVNGYAQGKDAYSTRMRRIEGQVRGIAKMIENDEYCGA